MKIFIDDSCDSWVTLMLKNCHRCNCNHNNNLQAQISKRDSFDTFFNFSATVNEFEKIVVRNRGYIKHGNEIRKTVKSVTTVNPVRITPYLTRNYNGDTFSMKLSPNCHNCHRNSKNNPSCEGNINNTEDTMKYKFSYGTKPKFTPQDAASFSRGKFECKHLMLTGQGRPVAVSHCTDPYEDYWRVEYDSCCIVFETEEDALLFCKVRFYDLNGKRLYRRPA